MSLSVDTLLSPRGYAVFRAFTSQQAIQRVDQFRPDLLVVDRDLRETTGAELCRLLLGRTPSLQCAPIVLFSNSPWSRDDRLEALRAGAWDTCSLPADGEELFLRLDGWVRAKLSADSFREQGLLDAATGLYNAHGLLRRIIELGAGAVRRRAALACVVIAPESTEGPLTGARVGSLIETIPARLRAAGRASDTIARLSETEFVVLAPDTDGRGARRLAERLKDIIEAGTEEHELSLRLRFGCYAVTDLRDASIAPTDMLIRAAEALRGQPASNDDSIRFFGPVAPVAD